MPFLIFDDRKQQQQQKQQSQNHPKSNNKMPSNYLNVNLMNVHSVNNSKLPLTRDYKMRQQHRNKYLTAYNHPPPPLATQKALAMMEYEMGNDLVLNNSKAYYKSELLNGDRRRR